MLSSNPGAIKLLEANQDKIDWYEIPENSGIIPLLEELYHPDDVDFTLHLAKNPAAMHLLENASYKSYFNLSANQGIFEYDYEGMHKSRTDLFHELVQVQFHPKNIEKFEGWALDD